MTVHVILKSGILTKCYDIIVCYTSQKVCHAKKNFSDLRFIQQHSQLNCSLMGLSLDVLLINLHDNNRVEVSNNVITELVTHQFYISKIGVLSFISFGQHFYLGLFLSNTKELCSEWNSPSCSLVDHHEQFQHHNHQH